MKKADYVNTSIGTIGAVSGYAHGGGKTYPGAVAPSGMMQLSPDTVTGGDNGSGYNYIMDTIEGFSVNHLSGIGWYGDLGNLQIMPVVGLAGVRSGTNEFASLRKTQEGWCSSFTHDSEITKAGYYSVNLDKYKVKAEMTALPHSGMMRFTYPKAQDSGLIFNFSRRIAGSADYEKIKIIDKTHIQGCIECTPNGGGFGHGKGGIHYNLYFCCELSKTPTSIEYFSDEEKIGFVEEIEGHDLGALFRFETEKDEEILLRIGISYVDVEGAIKNLRGEIDDFNFEEVKEQAQNLWEDALSIVDIEGTDESDKTLFYTCLYHALLDPRINADIDGRYTNSIGEISQSKEYTTRTAFSGWDVYRSEFPLLTIIRPDIVYDQIRTFLDYAEKRNCAFPRWELLGHDTECMKGDPAITIMADAYVKGIRGFDAEKAFAIAKASVLGETELFGKNFHPVRREAKLLTKFKYVPFSFYLHSLSMTLEDLMSDYALSRFAEALGKTEDKNHFEERSGWYIHSFNPKTGFMGPRNEDGSFIATKSEYDFVGCEESNILQQSWFVPYDTEGLIQLYGKERFQQILDRFFENAKLNELWNEDYNHSNEPCHHNVYLFHFLNQPKKTQHWVRRIQKESYSISPYGFCGNEDVGQISGWYVLSAFGFGQPCPSIPHYYLNTPLFNKVSIRLDKKYCSCKVSDTFVVKCDKDVLEYPYIESISLNGRPLQRNYITYEEISNGGLLDIKLTKKFL